jgi:2-aminoadipate transaminase
VEHPAYLGALQALESAGADIVAVPADAHGIRVDLLADRLAAGLVPKICYVAPNFQNPTGATLAADRRRVLGELADRYGFVVLEDDPYRELRFRGEHQPMVRAFGANVVTLGSTSKVLAPGLRVGWLVAPAWLVPAVVRLKQSRDLHTSSLSQWLAHDVLSDEQFLVGHRRALAAIYEARCDGLAAALRAGFADAVEFDSPEGGMFLWARMPGVDTTALLPKAARAGVAFVPGSAFHLDGGGADRARLSFATLLPAQMDEAVDRLVRAVVA